MAESTVRSPALAAVDRRLSVAPMMQRTDSHFRRFMRLLTRHTLLYTEMIPLGAILEGPRERSLRFDPREQPVALQVGGADPSGLAEAAGYSEAYGYRE
ncbi:MAG: tRNA-dihydrouridine synthase, partial [Rhodospirillales bacterium]|nr:tRNA-dihydrouridine synthase [Rhodospirillales bacterium]